MIILAAWLYIDYIQYITNMSLFHSVAYLSNVGPFQTKKHPSPVVFPKGAFRILRSADLVHWEKCGQVPWVVKS